MSRTVDGPADRSGERSGGSGRTALRLRRVLSTLLGGLFLFLLLVYWPLAVREANAAWGWPAWDHPLAAVAGVLLIMAGAGVFGYAMAYMTLAGSGTPVPTDPPSRLVTSGPFSRSRNPIYAGYALVLVGEALLFGEAALYLYVLLALVFFQVTTVWFEEPRLRRKFGEEYQDYTRRVRRWLGRRRPQPTGHRT